MTENERTEMVLTGDASQAVASVNSATNAVATNGPTSMYGVVEARIKAEVQARTLVALNRPRDLTVVREKMLADAMRPGFAEVAEYSIPRGGKSIVGPSIRFAEAALRAFTNSIVDVVVLHENDTERSGEVTVCDMETNQTYRQGFMVKKTIERKVLPRNTSQDDIVGTRVNAEGILLYLLPATEADILMKQNALTSRIIRTLALRLIPGDLIDDALYMCHKTQRDRDAKDPNEARNKLADSFMALGVGAADLKTYLGHTLNGCSPAELDDLRKVYAAIKEGSATWADFMSIQTAKVEESSSPTAKAASAVKSKLSKPSPVVDAVVIESDTPSSLI